MVYRCYIPEFLHSNILIRGVQKTLVRHLQNKCGVLQSHHVRCNSDTIFKGGSGHDTPSGCHMHTKL